jgi:hypothetical protein
MMAQAMKNASQQMPMISLGSMVTDADSIMPIARAQSINVDKLSPRDDAGARKLLARSCRPTTNFCCSSAQERRAVPTTAAFSCLPSETIVAH